MARHTRSAVLATGALLAAVTLAACSNDEPTGTDNSTDQSNTSIAADVNDADVMFAQMMIPHHQQAIEMSDMLLANEAAMTEVATLAEEIKAAQGPEIDTLNGWLTEWGVDSSAPMDHGDMSSDDGMMSDEDLAELESASGAEVNRLFLEQMIMHHEGAIAMAQEQVDNGQNADAIALAEDIIATQEAEIATMGSILGTLSDTTG